jgi:acyl carrier protein
LIGETAGSGTPESLVRLYPSARKTAATTAIRNEIAAFLRLDPAKIATSARLEELGIDSLSSFELWHRIEAALAMSIPLLGSPRRRHSMRSPTSPAR